MANHRNRVATALMAVVDTGVTTLSLAVLLGAALDRVRPGSAIHPLFVGSTGVTALDSMIAPMFAMLVLLPTPLLLRFPRASRVASVVAGVLVTALAGQALGRHALALIDGRLRAAGWAPPATLVAMALVVPWTICATRRRTATRSDGRPARRLVRIALAGVALVFALLNAFGATDYRAPADAILVLGSKVNEDGSPSGSLLDRTRTACALWKDGLAPLLVMSGGRDPTAAASEPEVMRRIAREAGVPDAAIVLDESGVDTASSVRFLSTLLHERGLTRAIVVSHDYHLARVRLLADRAGIVVRTVPAVETSPSRWKVRAIAREVAAYVATWALLN